MYWRTSTIEILPAVEDDDANLRIQEPSGRDFFGTDETTVSARRFINDVSALLDQISRSVIGETILNGIKFTGKSMTISPYLNARAAQLKPSGLPFGRCNALGGRDIEFSPGRAVVCGRELPAASAAFRPVEILLHELFHTFRVLSKKFKPSDVNIPDRVYDDSEEFHAILICNLFIVDPLYTAGNASQLRKHHKDKSLLPESETKPFGFFFPSTQVKTLVDSLCTDHPIFTRWIAAKLSDVAFNPLRDALRFPKITATVSGFDQSSAPIATTTAIVRAALMQELPCSAARAKTLADKLLLDGCISRADFGA